MKFLPMLAKQYLFLKEMIDRLLPTIYVRGEGFCQQLTATACKQSSAESYTH